MSSSIENPHLTGVFSVIAFVLCCAINFAHFYLSKTSKTRQTLFGRRLIIWSHTSMICVGLAPLFMICSYFHPEFLIDTNICLCQQWYAFAVMSFATGLFLLKINYLVRLNMVLNPGRMKRCSPFLAIYFGILITEMIVINTIQYMVIQADCNINQQYGCNASFETWNGWLATGILIHDMTLYYLFCVYYIRKVKGKLNRKRKTTSQMVKLQMAVAASVDNTETSTEQVSKSVGSPSTTINADSKLSIQSDSVEVSRAKEREKLSLTRQKRKMALVYNGLIRQFRVTLLAIAVCAIDLVINTIWMDYNMLWLFMLDCFAVTIFNFLAFRDSQYFIMKCFEMAQKFGCESCSYLIDVCCCMRDNTIDGNNNDETTTVATSASSSSATQSSEPSEPEDSFLRFDANEIAMEQFGTDGIDGINGTSGDSDGTEITAVSGK